MIKPEFIRDDLSLTATNSGFFEIRMGQSRTELKTVMKLGLTWHA